jgi:metal-dependent amidase/aminoacylase/carboxypeptidase family protein
LTHFEGQAELGKALESTIRDSASGIEDISREIFENPEQPFGEERASSLLVNYLDGIGYEVETGVAGLPTAFVGRLQHHDTEATRKGLRHGHVAIIAEYDTGENGHLAGRHLVAGAALASAVGLATVLKTMHGDVSIIGCPAASTAEGKRLLADEDVFEAPDLAMGAFPAANGYAFQPTINSTGGTLASAHLVVRFAGDAGESEARQRLATAVDSQLRDLGSHSSVQTSLAETGVEFDLISEATAGVDDLVARIEELAHESARETSSTVTVDVSRRTPALNVSRILARRAKTFADRLGLKQDAIVKTPPDMPSDWGHLTQSTAAVRIRYQISEDPVEHGTAAFAEASNSRFAYDQMISASIAVGLTCLDCLGDMEFRGFVEGELIRTLNSQGIKRVPRRWLGVHPVLPRTEAKDTPAKLGPLAPPRRG